MLKKIVMMTAVLVMAGKLSMAQNLSFGPTVGVNFADLHGLKNTSLKSGLAAGGFFNYSIKTSFGIGAQILYSQMGANINENTDQINLNYIQVPVLATYYFGTKNEAGSIRPKLFVGPHLNFLLNSSNKAGNDINPDGTRFNAVDFGATLGGGLNYNLGSKSWINFDVRYGIGLIDISKDPNVTMTNRGLSVNLGVSFPIGSI